MLIELRDAEINARNSSSFFSSFDLIELDKQIQSYVFCQSPSRDVFNFGGQGVDADAYLVFNLHVCSLSTLYLTMSCLIMGHHHYLYLHNT